MADRTGSGPRGEAFGALSWLWASCEKVSLSESDSLDRRLSRRALERYSMIRALIVFHFVLISSLKVLVIG